MVSRISYSNRMPLHLIDFKVLSMIKVKLRANYIYFFMSSIHNNYIIVQPYIVQATKQQDIELIKNLVDAFERKI